MYPHSGSYLRNAWYSLCQSHSRENEPWLHLWSIWRICSSDNSSVSRTAQRGCHPLYVIADMYREEVRESENEREQGCKKKRLHYLKSIVGVCVRATVSNLSISSRYHSKKKLKCLCYKNEFSTRKAAEPSARRSDRREWTNLSRAALKTHAHTYTLSSERPDEERPNKSTLKYFSCDCDCNCLNFMTHLAILRRESCPSGIWRGGREEGWGGDKWNPAKEFANSICPILAVWLRERKKSGFLSWANIVQHTDTHRVK